MPTSIVSVKKNAKFNKLAWLVILTTSLLFFYTFIQINLFNSIEDQLMESFRIDAGQLGQLSAMYFYANLVFLFPAGSLLDRYSTKKLVLMAMSISTLSTFVFGFSHTFQAAACTRFMTGVAGAFCFLSAIRLASRWFPASKMAFTTGVIVTMAMIGGLIAQTPFALLSEKIGWRSVLVLDGCLGVGIITLMVLIIRDRPPGHTQDDTLDHQQLEKMGLWQSIHLTFLYHQNWLNGLYTSLLNLPVFILGALWGIPYLMKIHHLTHAEASYATTCFFLGIIVGSPFYGWVSDTIKKRRLPMIVGAVLSLIVSLLLMIVPELSLSTIIMLLFLMGFVTSSQVLSYPTIAELNPNELTGTAVSIASISIMLGGAVAQPLFGYLLGMHWNREIVHGIPVFSVSDFNTAMSIIPISMMISLILAFFVKETHCRPLK